MHPGPGNLQRQQVSLLRRLRLNLHTIGDIDLCPVHNALLLRTITVCFEFHYSSVVWRTSSF